MHFYPFNIGDFALHTSHLTLEEEGVYRRLLDFYYDTELPIPIKTQTVIRRLRLGSYGETVALVLEEFFIKQDDGWHNLRADIEIADYHSKVETSRANGKKGGRPKKNSGPKTQSVILANPDLTQTKAKHKLLTKNHKPITIKKKGFIKPTITELVDAFAGKVTDSGHQAGLFLCHYESNGWRVGKNPMKSWQHAVTNWITRSKQNGTGQQFGQKVVSKSERRDEAARRYLEENNDDGVAWPASNEVSP